MGMSFVDAFVRGHRGAWVGLLVVLVILSIVALTQRGPRSSPRRVLLLSGLVSALAASSTLLTMALAIPRLVWSPVPPPPYAVAAGDTWRSLRAPATTLVAAGKAEIGLACADAAGSVRLCGLFSGAPIEGLPEAPSRPPVAGEPRICAASGENCRAWPRAWPAPSPSPGGSDMVWIPDLIPGALAYDAGTGRYLYLRTAGEEVAMAGTAGTGAVRLRGASGEGQIEQIGRITDEPGRDGRAALFVARRIADGRLEAVRVVSTPAEGSFMFAVERAAVSLRAAPAAYNYFARPLSLALLVWFPVVTMLLMAAPAWWASRRRKRMERGEPLSEMPGDAAHFMVVAREAMAARLYPFAVLSMGLSLLSPAVVAVVALLTSR